MVERAPDGERVVEMALAGWCKCTLWDWQRSMRKRQSRSGSLLSMFSMLSTPSLWCYGMQQRKMYRICANARRHRHARQAKSTGKHRHHLPLGRC